MTTDIDTIIRAQHKRATAAEIGRLLGMSADAVYLRGRALGVPVGYSLPDPLYGSHHGTRSTYTKGCRCALCRHANADYMAGSRRRGHILAFLVENPGATVRAIGKAVGLSSSATVQFHLDRLAAAHLIRRQEHRPSAWEVVP